MRSCLAAAVLMLFCLGWESAAFAGDESSPKAKALTSDTPVLQINGRKVQKIWYDRIAFQLAQEHSAAGSDVASGNEMFRRTTLERLIEQEILYDLALKSGPPDMDEEISRRVTSLKSKLGTDDAYADWLSGQKMEERHLRHLLKRELVSAWYLQKAREEVTVSEKEVEDFYETQKSKFYVAPEKREIYQILAAEARGKESALGRLKEVVALHGDGQKSFSELAREYSDEPVSRLVGGYIGVRAREELPPEVGEACFQAKPGELTPIVHSDWGYHVCLVTEVVPAVSKTLDEVRPDAVERITEFKAQKLLQNRLKAEGRAARVEILMHP